MGSTANQVWEAISSHSAALAEQAGKAIVAVDAGHRVAASGVQWKPGIIVTASHLVRRAEEVECHSAGRQPGEGNGRRPRQRDGSRCSPY